MWLRGEADVLLRSPIFLYDPVHLLPPPLLATFLTSPPVPLLLSQAPPAPLVSLLLLDTPSPSHLRASAPALHFPKGLHGSPPHLLQVSVQSYLLSQTFLDHPLKKVSHSGILVPYPALFFSMTLISIWHTVYYTYLFLVCLPTRRKFHKNMDFHVLSLRNIIDGVIS